MTIAQVLELEEQPVGETTPLALKSPRPVLKILPPDRLQSARELLRRREERREPPLATALPVLDRLLGGGLPRGELVEVVGRRSSGRFSTLLAALAAVTAAGEAAALVDLGDHLDPQAAAALGMELGRLLWLRPRRLRQALAATEMLIAGGFPLVALDLGAPPLSGGGATEGFWLRLARAAEARGTALIVSSPYRVSGTAAGGVLHAETARPAWSGGGGAPRLLARLSCRFTLEKHRGRHPGASESLELTVPAAAPFPAAGELAC